MRPEIEKIAAGDSGAIYRRLTDSIPQGIPASQFASRVWGAWNETMRDLPGGQKQQYSGKIFELMLADVLVQHGILPFYWQAEFALIPNARFDFICYRPKAPIVLAAKSSLRERWKQADLEGLALRNVYRRAESHLITANEREAANISAKIKREDVFGINQCILVDSAEFDSLINRLAGMRFSAAKPENPINNGGLLIGNSP